MEIVYTKEAPEALGPYSQAIKVNGMVFTSGQIAINPASNKIEESTIEGQTEQVMKNLGQILKSSNSGFDKAIKTVCFLADMNDFGKFNEIYGKYFISKPARSCVSVKTLPKNVLVDVECIALVD